MTEQHNEIIGQNAPQSEAAKREQAEYGIISVVAGEGIKHLFEEQGCHYVLKSDNGIWNRIARDLPLLGFLVIINVVLPVGFVLLLNRSFTKRIRGLSKVFQSVNGEHLVRMTHENGGDEIVLSNGYFSGVGNAFDTISVQQKTGYLKI